jgi:hypothetical protein
MDHQQHQKSTHPRPLGVTVLAWTVLSLTVLNGLRLLEAIRGWNFLLSLEQTPPVLYIAISGLIWSLIGVPLFLGLILGRPWAVGLMRVAAIAYAAYYWLDRILIADRSVIANRWLFDLALTVSLLVAIFWVLSRPKSNRFFHPPQA